MCTRGEKRGVKCPAGCDLACCSSPSPVLGSRRRGLLARYELHGTWWLPCRQRLFQLPSVTEGLEGRCKRQSCRL